MAQNKEKKYKDIYARFIKNKLFKSALKNKKIQFIEIK